MADNTVEISGVNVVLLEKQRLNLVNVITKMEQMEGFTTTDYDTINGLQNMLDDWSDKIYFESQK